MGNFNVSFSQKKKLVESSLEHTDDIHRQEIKGSDLLPSLLTDSGVVAKVTLSAAGVVANVLCRQ